MYYQAFGTFLVLLASQLFWGTFAQDSFKDIDGKRCQPNLLGRKEKKFPNEGKTCICVHKRLLAWEWKCFDDNDNELPSSTTMATTTGETPIDSAEWEKFKLTHKKKYRSKEHYDQAKKNYHNNVARVKHHNAEYEKGNRKHKLRINKFADMDEATFHATHKGIYKGRVFPSQSSVNSLASVNADVPATFDWRNKDGSNYVSNVRDQDPCGDCWTFATMGALESQMIISIGKYIQLSEQQLVDCDNTQGACDGGGWPDLAYDYLKTAGAMAENDYPYSSGDDTSSNYGKTGSCQYDKSKIVQNVTGYNLLSMPTTDELLMQALVNNGPQAVTLDASLWDSQYSEGYVTCPENPKIEHAVLLIGYGTDSQGLDYWTIKNQWGTGWGYEGFGYIPRGGGSSSKDCGITQFQSVSPTIN